MDVPLCIRKVKTRCTEDTEKVRQYHARCLSWSQDCDFACCCCQGVLATMAFLQHYIDIVNARICTPFLGAYSHTYRQLRALSRTFCLSITAVLDNCSFWEFSAMLTRRRQIERYIRSLCLEDQISLAGYSGRLYRLLVVNRAVAVLKLRECEKRYLANHLRASFRVLEQHLL